MSAEHWYLSIAGWTFPGFKWVSFFGSLLESWRGLRRLRMFKNSNVRMKIFDWCLSIDNRSSASQASPSKTFKVDGFELLKGSNSHRWMFHLKLLGLSGQSKSKTSVRTCFRSESSPHKRLKSMIDSTVSQPFRLLSFDYYFLTATLVDLIVCVDVRAKRKISKFNLI